MRMEFILEGLSCADCAAKIERAANDIHGVSSAALNFITSTLRLDIIENSSMNDINTGLYKTVTDLVHEYEPEVCVTEKKADVQNIINDCCESEGNDGGYVRKKIQRLCAGAVLLTGGIITEHFTSLNGFITTAVFIAGYLLLGGDVILSVLKNLARSIARPDKQFLEKNIFTERFLMTAATLGAFAIGESAEAVAVMLFYQIGLIFEDMAMSRSRKSIMQLMDIRPDYANLQTADGKIMNVSPEEVQPGDIIIVKPGEKIPLDGIVAEGAASLDTSALTGESAPRGAAPGDKVFSGCVNLNGFLKIEVTLSYRESTVSRILELVENAAEKKAPAEKFITKFARYYTPAVIGLAMLIALIPPLFVGGDWGEWLRRGLICLVISCPCALVVSVPLSFFAGLGGASAKGVLIKGGNYLDALARVDTVVFDKTGTLTKGVFNVTAIEPAGGFSGEELLEAAAYAETHSNHPIAVSILREYEKSKNFCECTSHDHLIDHSNAAASDITASGEITEYSEIAGYGVSVCVRGVKLFAGNKKLMDKIGVDIVSADSSGAAAAGAVVHVAADGAYMGRLIISDEIRQDSKNAIAELKSRNVNKIAMLTGDNARYASVVADELGVTEVHADLLPQQKVEILEKMNSQKQKGGVIAFVGDGVNDAPVLAMADVGVAMGGLGADAAIEAADVVLMTDEPSKLLVAIGAAKFTRHVAIQNIIFALGIKAVFLLLGAIGAVSMWEAVFADVGVMVIAVLNAMRAKNYKG